MEDFKNLEFQEFFEKHAQIIKKLEGYYCYLNVPNKNERIILIHIHSCGFCNYGTGRNMEGNEPGRNGAWLGPFSKNEQVNELLNQFIPENSGIKIENCNCVNKNK
jgi:hypothetical protein